MARRFRRGAAGARLDEYADAFSGVVKVTISRLRRKLGEPAAIETVPRAGYRLRS